MTFGLVYVVQSETSLRLYVSNESPPNSILRNDG